MTKNPRENTPGEEVRTEAKASDIAKLITTENLWVIVIGAVAGGIIFGLAGELAEEGRIALPRLEPLFASSSGSVTFLFAVAGASLGALIAALATLKQAHGKSEKRHHSLNFNRWLAWGIAVFTASIIITAASYIWFLSAAYGPGSDQETRIGYTMKNVQRIPGDTPEQAGFALAEILGGPRFDAPADPIAAAVLAPVAASRGQTLIYGGAGAQDIESFATQSVQLLNESPVVVIISGQEPAYALPAAYAASRFQAPVVPLTNGSLPASVRSALAGGDRKQFLVAAPEQLVPEPFLKDLEQYGTVERAASDNIYRHALIWARGRWGNFGWGMNERVENDGYYYFTLANPETPAFAAAGLPMAYLGNYGPLLYTERDDLADLTDQYLWRLSPDFFAFPSDGPFMNVRVVGSPDSVSYNAQARADLALEVHAYEDQKTGASSLAILAWSWFIIGLAGAIWALFTMPARLPDTGFYPRLYWPLAVLILGPLGLLAFLTAYHGRTIEHTGHMARYIRPPWARAVSATIMGIGIGMALMIASMYLFQLTGMPLFTTFGFTPLFWLGAPMSALMWMVMVIPAIILSILFYMGPMMAEMHSKSYSKGIQGAAPVVVISMLSASAGMWILAWYLMNFTRLMSNEDLWLWITPLWLAAIAGFFTAFIPNYLMVEAGWKEGWT